MDGEGEGEDEDDEGARDALSRLSMLLELVQYIYKCVLMVSVDGRVCCGVLTLSLNSKLFLMRARWERVGTWSEYGRMMEQ